MDAFGECLLRVVRRSTRVVASSFVHPAHALERHARQHRDGRPAARARSRQQRREQVRAQEARRARQQHARPIATSSTVVVLLPTGTAALHAATAAVADAAIATAAAAAAVAFTAAPLASHLHGRRLRLSHPKGRWARRATRLPIPRAPCAVSTAIFAVVAVATTVAGDPLRRGARSARRRATAQ
eukprot:7291749-Prymnesium_polylepis.1